MEVKLDQDAPREASRAPCTAALEESLKHRDYNNLPDPQR